MQLWEEKLLEQQDAREEGREEGRKLTQVQLIRKKLNSGMSPDTIASFLEFDIDIVKQINDRIQVEQDVSDEELTLFLKEQ